MSDDTGESLLPMNVTYAAPSLVPSPIPAGPAGLVALAKDLGAEQLQMLIAMWERQEAREAEKEFNRALSRLPVFRVKKNGTIDLGKGKPIPFAKWEDMMAIVGPALAEQGLRLTFRSDAHDRVQTITAILLHRDGHSASASISLPTDTGPGRNSLQAEGSTLSYGMRYTTEMLLNVVREGADDDGKLGGTKFISGEQCRKIEALIAETESNREQFLQYFGLADVPNMTEAAYVPAVNMLNQKLQRMGA